MQQERQKGRQPSSKWGPPMPPRSVQCVRQGQRQRQRLWQEGKTKCKVDCSQMRVEQRPAKLRELNSTSKCFCYVGIGHWAGDPNCKFAAKARRPKPANMPTANAAYESGNPDGFSSGHVRQGFASACFEGTVGHDRCKPTSYDSGIHVTPLSVAPWDLIVSDWALQRTFFCRLLHRRPQKRVI